MNFSKFNFNIKDTKNKISNNNDVKFMMFNDVNTKLYKEKLQNLKNQTSLLKHKTNSFLINPKEDIFKQPITSIGIIGFMFNEILNDYQYLLIRRKDSLGYVDFIRGKYNVFNKQYIMNILNEMTIQERERLVLGFDENWKALWGDLELKQRYLNEEAISREKYKTLIDGVKTVNETYTLDDCLKNVTTNWKEPEWGFPKGRREYQEKELNTAIREFCEETGINNENINIINNLLPFEETFNGSNFKSYKHKYYLAKIEPNSLNLNRFQMSEVSAVDFFSLNNAIERLRDYDIEKITILKKIHHILHNYKIV